MGDESGGRGGTASGVDETSHVLDGQTVSTPSLDTVFGLLANRRRRYVCYYLVTRVDATVSVDELVEQIASWEEKLDDTRPDRKALAAAVRHVHLPQLADADVIDYDPRSDTIRYWGQPTVEEYAQHAAMQELPEE